MKNIEYQMNFTKEEARAYLKWHKEKEAEYHYLARFKSSRPFVIDYPDAYEKKRKAKIVLGIHLFQRPFEIVRSVWPRITFCEYVERRIKYQIV